MDTSALRHPILGIMAAALAAPTAFFVYGLFAGSRPAEFTPSAIFLAASIIYTFGLMVSLPASLVFGLPYFLWLRACGRLSWLSVCGGAAVIGACVITGLWLASFQSYKPLWVFAVLGLASGLLSGAAFCAVVRPNNSLEPNALRSTDNAAG